MTSPDIAALLKEGIEAFERQDFSRALDLLLPIATGGNPQAQCYIASIYQGGLGIPVDGEKAVEWYLRAAEQHELKNRISGVAYNNLATIFSTGMPGIPSNPELAKTYWRKAAELGVEMIPKEWYAENNRGQNHQ